MKKLITRTLLIAVLCIGNVPIAKAQQDTTDPVVRILITELQTGGTSSGTQEFVELLNPGEETVDVTGWLLQYRSASATQTWSASTTKATISCSGANCRVTMQPGSRLVLALNMPELTHALAMEGGFSDKGGQVRLVQPDMEQTQELVHDLVGYGTAVHSEGNAPAATPSAGKSLKRVTSQDGTLIDTDNNAKDFIANCGSPTPGMADQGTLPLVGGCYTPSDTSTETDETQDNTQNSENTNNTTDTTQNPDTISYLPLVITEALPDPTPPQQDDADEFIEIYNPNDTAVNLKNYRLQTGSDYRYTFTLGDTPLEPHAYVAVFSTVSHLSLSNSGSGVRLIDPAGAITYEMPAYGNAKQGQSWMQSESGWQWTLSPSPGAPNILTQPAPKTAILAPAKKKTPTKAKNVTKKANAPKPPKIPVVKKSTKKDESEPSKQIAATNAPGHYWLLLPIGALAAGYAAYEYRQDIAKVTRKGWIKMSGKKPDPPDNPPIR